MKVGVLGTGGVGQKLAGKMASIGQDVMIGTRDVQACMARTEAGWGAMVFSEWQAKNPDVKVGTFAQTAAHGEILFNATAGMASLDALKAAGAKNLEGKVLVDVSNPLDFSKGFPPSLSVSNTDSLGERIQRSFPGVKVVKTLNTVNMELMVDPSLVAGGDHHLFVSGNDAGAKAEVTKVLKDWFGWREIIDLGDITSARGPEMALPLWLRLTGAFQTPMINFKIVR